MRERMNEQTYTTTKHITTLLLRSRVKISEDWIGGQSGEGDWFRCLKIGYDPIGCWWSYLLLFVITSRHTAYENHFLVSTYWLKGGFLCVALEGISYSLFLVPISSVEEFPLIGQEEEYRQPANTSADQITLQEFAIGSQSDEWERVTESERGKATFLVSCSWSVI